MGKSRFTGVNVGTDKPWNPIVEPRGGLPLPRPPKLRSVADFDAPQIDRIVERAKRRS